ncbi:MAG: 50S ribosomal protein L9 [Deltaproteobacteria bacterium]|nr:50S ribosomal protein L9 [Deltaproteobacteria bacterium]
MKVILNQDVDQVGRAGQVLDVSDGFGRNYLLPRGLALLATPRAAQQVEHRKRLVASRLVRQRKDADGLKARLEEVACKIAREAGEEDKLFGSVTTRDIADALAEEGIELDHRKVVLDAPIKNLGVFHVDVKLAPEVVAKVKVWVVAK